MLRRASTKPAVKQRVNGLIDVARPSFNIRLLEFTPLDAPSTMRQVSPQRCNQTQLVVGSVERRKMQVEP